MNSRQMVELAALVSARAPTFVDAANRLPEGAVEECWSSNRQRQTRWVLALDQYRSLTSHKRGERYASLWIRTHGMIEEILCAEVLTRVWGATLTALDQRCRETRIEPIVRDVLGRHLEARRRALELLVDGPRVPWEDAAELDSLRRRAERWTDLLVAPLVLEHDVHGFAFDAERSADFAEAFNTGESAEDQPAAWSVLMPSLRLLFRRHDKPAPHWEENQRIATAFVKCFPEGLFPPAYGERRALTAN